MEAPPDAPPTEVVAPLALHLADFLKRCGRLEADPALADSWQTFEPPVGIWRNPPRPDADLTVEVPDSEWILEIAEFGRSLAESVPGPMVIGHIDWRPDNVRIATDGTLAAVFDWDSVQLTHRVHVITGACTALSPQDLEPVPAAHDVRAIDRDRTSPESALSAHPSGRSTAIFGDGRVHSSVTQTRRLGAGAQRSAVTTSSWPTRRQRRSACVPRARVGYHRRRFPRRVFSRVEEKVGRQGRIG